MATKYWNLGSKGANFWIDEDGLRQESEFLYLGNDGRFYYQSDFNRFDEIDKLYAADTCRELDRFSLFDDACIEDCDFAEIESGAMEWRGERVPYFWRALRDGEKITASLFAKGENAKGEMEYMEVVGPGWYDESADVWFGAGSYPEHFREWPETSK